MRRTGKRKFRGFWLPVLLGFFLQAGIAASGMRAAQDPEPDIKRLILKDGSYELIGQYEVRGNRVRYYSTERHAWEELPDSMIDWPATKSFATRSAVEASGRIQEALSNAAREHSEEEARTPLIAPGMRLPAPEGVFLLNVYQGRPELVRLNQNGADLHKNTGTNILRGVINPIASSRQTVELKGLRARIQSHTTTPEIYFPIDPADADAGYDSETAKDHIRLVRCEKKKQNRIVIAYNIAVYGKVSRRAQYVEATIEPVTGYWVKIVPLKPLAPGEYALVEWEAGGSVNHFVWDFGVDPAAPPNPAVQRDNPDRTEPVLIQKSAE